jgi:amino acid adenylation domain-containing protein
MHSDTNNDTKLPVYQVIDTSPVTNTPSKFSSIHKYFEEQALLSPHATALITEEQSLTFGQLNEKASQLAVYLAQHSIGPDTTVAIFLPRSIDAVIALLACLKSGATQLPICTNYPISFIEFILDDARPDLILARDETPFNTSIDILRVDRLTFNTGSSLSSSPDWSGDALAWILYTSGSTSSPKAVRGLHRGIVQRCESLWALHPFTQEEVTIQNTALTVVDSHWEIWGALAKGISVVLLDDDINQDLPKLVKSLNKFKVTRICMVPSLLRSILTTIDDLGNTLPYLKEWIVSGEVLSSNLVGLFYKNFPEAILRNQYGLTETSADITSFDTRLLNNHSINTEIVPIGRPFPGVEVYILDENLIPVADGQEGELFIAGDCLVDGYLNKPDLTAKRFFTNPFRATGEKLLSTGDLARRLEKGDILVSGRADRQVKVRGYRVELDGLESFIGSHQDVVLAASICVRGNKGNMILITYVQVRQGAVITPQDIRTFCANNLPKYMIPHKIVFLDEMPCTSSGKINRKALPEVINTVAEIVDRPDLSIAEDTLRRIWCHLLDLPDINSYESFFQVGGDSLTMMTMLSEVRKEFRCEIPLRYFILEPTIENMYHLLHNSDSEDIGPQSISFINLDEIRAIELSEKVLVSPVETPLSVAQSSIYLHEQAAVEGNPYGITISAMLYGSLDLKAMKAAVAYTVKTNPLLSVRIFMTADGPRQRIHDGSNICFDVIYAPPRDMSESIKEQYIKEQVTKVSSNRINLEQSPPLYIRVLKIADEEAVLIIQVHHLICDGKSIQVFMQRLSEAYVISATGRLLPEKKPDLRFLAYCWWESQLLNLYNTFCTPQPTPAENQDALAAAIKYWEKTLPNLEQTDILKTDIAKDIPSMSVTGKEVVVAIDKNKVNALIEQIPLSGVTPFHLFFACYSRSLYQTLGYSNQLIGFVTGLRPEEYNDVLGCYATALPCFIKIRNGTTDRALLNEVSKTLWNILSYGPIPFKIALSHMRAKGFARSFRGIQTVVSLDDQPTRSLQLLGVRTEPRRFHSGFSNFPLELKIEVTDTGFVFAFEYRTELYYEKTISRLSQNFLHTLFCFAHDS